MLLIVLGVIILVIWIYVIFVRNWLESKFPDEYGWLNKTERMLWDKSRTILVARFYWLAGLLVGLQQLAASAGVDVTPFVTQLSEYIPEGYRGLAISLSMIVTGVGFEYLRKLTTNPVEDQK